jgi:SOS response regulatory protein OraA/RecX
LAPRVSALLARPRERIEIELDGERWRVVPAEVVLGSGLDVGVELDRPRARRLRRALRRHEAMEQAARLLGGRALVEKELADRLASAGIAPTARSEAIERLTRAGAIDDERLACRRAEQLAERGAGDALIRHDLLDRGVADEVVQSAVRGLEPESNRAAGIVEKRGASLKTVRHLARKGFSTESIERTCQEAIAEDAPGAVR